MGKYGTHSGIVQSLRLALQFWKNQIVLPSGILAPSPSNMNPLGVSVRDAIYGETRRSNKLKDVAVGGVMKQFLVLGAAVLTLAVGACASSPPPGSDASPKFASYVEGAYRIGVDDRIQVTVWRNPELSVTVPVRPDGKISVPLIGDVEAGGHTPEEVATIIRQKLSTFIREPNVAVILTELRSHEFLSRVRVTGAVRAPRSMAYRQGMTVLDAVLEAGGVNDFAAPNRTKLYRKDSARTDVYDVDLGDILNKGKLDTNFSLLPGDVVTVPERLF